MKSGEVQLNCPKCGHPRFYFNTILGVGFCHRAKCGFSPRKENLEKFLKQNRIKLDLPDVPEPKPENIKLEWPVDVVPLLNSKLIAHCDSCEETVRRIETNRNVSRVLQYKHKIRASENRIYIPVYSESILVNYVGRIKWWYDSSALKYKYFSGVKTTDYIFNWDHFKNKDRIAFVENTFNAIWLEYLNVTTNFGSNLSAVQIQKIAESKVSKVCLLWDSGAEAKAEKAVSELRAAGVSATFVRINGQPDNFRFGTIEAILDSAWGRLDTGDHRPLDCRDRLI